jgi:hypothetical protein
MTRVHAIELLALTTLSLFASAAFAQITFNPNIDQRAGRDDCQKSVGASRTRARARCEPRPAAPTAATPAATPQQELRVTLDVPELPTAQCEATSTTEYQQRNTIARVNTTVSVTNCSAASGEYTVAARIRDESGATSSLEFNETWQRSDAQDVKLAGDYPIGENVDLVNVRVRGLTCTCADAPADAVADAPPNQP